MTETTIPTGGDPRQPGPAPENRRRLVIAAALLALSVALVGAYLILGGSGSTSTAGPVPHVRSPNSAVPSTRAPTRPPAGTPSAGAVVVRNPFLPLVVPAPAGPSAAVATGTGGSGAPATGTGAGVTGTGGTGGTSGGTGAGTTATGSPGPGTTGSGSIGSGVNGTSGSAGAAAPAAAVDGTPNFTG